MGLKPCLSAVAGNSGPFALILLRDPSKSHSVGGGLKITFSGGWSQNHIQWGVVSKSHSVGCGLKITFSGGWSQNHIQCGMVRPPREHRFGSLSSAGLFGEFESRSGRDCQSGE